MKRLISSIAVVVTLVALISSSAFATPADSRAHHAAVKLCKQKYKDAVRGAKYLRGRDRRARYEQARKERADCIALAPK